MTAGGGLATSKLELANAQPGDAISGKTFYAGDKVLKTGAMTNRGAWNATIEAEASVTIPKGFHSGSGKVTANPQYDSLIYAAFIASTATSSSKMSVSHGNSSYFSRTSITDTEIKIKALKAAKMQFYAYSKDSYSGNIYLEINGERVLFNNAGTVNWDGVRTLPAGATIVMHAERSNYEDKRNSTLAVFIYLAR